MIRISLNNLLFLWEKYFLVLFSDIGALFSKDGNVFYLFWSEYVVRFYSVKPTFFLYTFCLKAFLVFYLETY